jgi:hypothetical protein
VPTQQQIADHLFMAQPTAHKHLARLAIDWKIASMDEIRGAYLEHLRGQGQAGRLSDGTELTRERALTEQVDRQLKEHQLADKRAQLVNVAQLTPAIDRMVAAWRASLLASDELLKAELDAFYGIDLDIRLLNKRSHQALRHLSSLQEPTL